MNPFLVHITEETKNSLNKPHESNRVYYSELNQWFTRNAFRSFSMKYVINGSIHYQTDHHMFNVEAGSFLLAEKRENVQAFFESADITKSICVDINSETISEAATIMSSKENFDFDNYLDRRFQNPIIFEQIYSVQRTLIGEKLKQLTQLTQNEKNEQLNKEWFLEMAELIILQEKGNYLAFNGLKTVKTSTKKETLHRLKKAIAYMNNCFLSNPDIGEIACFCNMSEFHFFRSFKQAFGITPYKYLLKRRLEFSKELLLQKLPAKEIAIQCGFADVFTYSKAFKRTFGVSPTIYQKQ